MCVASSRRQWLVIGAGLVSLLELLRDVFENVMVSTAASGLGGLLWRTLLRRGRLKWGLSANYVGFKAAPLGTCLAVKKLTLTLVNSEFPFGDGFDLFDVIFAFTKNIAP